MHETDAADTDRRVNGSRIVAVAIIVVAAVAGYFALGMPGMGHGGSTSSDGGGMAGMGSTNASGMAVGVGEFATRLTDPRAFVVNVHVPYAGRIAGTDAMIPYDRIAGDSRLPTDRSTPVVLYCKTGRMSALAATTLMNAGYTNVVYLDGGMDAWVRAGRQLE